jgi:DNA-binding response OmpR family regulator
LSNVLVLTNSAEPAAEILPSLTLLAHAVRIGPAEPVTLAAAPDADVVLVDARRDLVRARQLSRLLHGSGSMVPVLAIVTEGGWAAVTPDWGTDDLVLHTAGPGEVEARLRLAVGRAVTPGGEADAGEVRAGDLAIDEAAYSARLRGRPLDLTFKEFELLKFLAQHPRRVFTRSQLLQEVWGYDYFGGTRTVDVHVRRLRAKLGPEHEALIGTVRNVGYRFVPGAADSGGGSGQGAGPAADGEGPAAGLPGSRAEDGAGPARDRPDVPGPAAVRGERPGTARSKGGRPAHATR